MAKVATKCPLDYGHNLDLKSLAAPCSGNFTLHHAAAFPHCLFHAVDFNRSAIEILQERTEAAGLTNLTASVGRIEDYEGSSLQAASLSACVGLVGEYEESFDVALALHACGNVTDYALIQSQLNRAAFICSPCCIGNLKFSPSLCGSENSEGSRAEEEGGSEGGGVLEIESDAASTRLRIQRLLQHPPSRCSPCCIGKLKFSPSLCGSEHSEGSPAEEEGGGEGGGVLESDSDAASTRLRIQHLLQHPRAR
eukprot:gene25369-11031_t